MSLSQKFHGLLTEGKLAPSLAAAIGTQRGEFRNSLFSFLLASIVYKASARNSREVL